MSGSPPDTVRISTGRRESAGAVVGSFYLFKYSLTYL